VDGVEGRRAKRRSSRGVTRATPKDTKALIFDGVTTASFHDGYRAPCTKPDLDSERDPQSGLSLGCDVTAVYIGWRLEKGATYAERGTEFHDAASGG
jgi:hypothetical protein